MAKIYDLEKRIAQFARDYRVLVKTIPKDLANIEDYKQLVKASGSVAANYIEANESVHNKDFRFSIKICRKEAKESRLWLNLLHISERDSTKSAMTWYRRQVSSLKFLRQFCQKVHR